MASIGIIGAGISGLAAAYRLDKEGLNPIVLEQRSQPGGMIYSERFDAPTTAGEYLVEFGPNSLRASTALLEELLEDLDLEDERVEAAEAAQRRYIVFSGRPVALPSSLRELVSTELFSPQAKLRLLAEPIIAPASREESVAAFTRRRLGQEVLDYALNPFTAGVFAGDPEELSLQHAFPHIYELEQRHGSLIGGSVRKALGGLVRRLSSSDDERDTTKRRMFTLRKGLGSLPRALGDRLGDRLYLDSEVQSLHYSGDQWHVRFSRHDEDETAAFDALVWTAPLHVLLSLAPALNVDLKPLEKVSYPAVSVVAMGFPREAVEHPLDGFGVLVPAAESACRTLGTLFSSTVFPHRAPENRVLLTTFVGGARTPSLAGAPDEEVYEAVHHDLRHVLGAHDPPTFRRRMYWPCAIPQYHVGYGKVTDCIDHLEASCPGLFLAGNYRSGISVGDAADSGGDAARRVAEHVS